MIMKEKKELCFGWGFRKFTPTREVSTFPSTRVGEISLEVDPIEQFRFETETFGDSASYRLRSDVSMLLHAADLAKRAGVSTAQRFLVNSYVGCKVVPPRIVTGKQIGRAHV